MFRPREKTHRPQTRRRRENNPDSLDKLNMIADNIKMALQLFELVVKRERRKRDMTYVVTDWQQLQIKQRFEPRAEHDAVSEAGGDEWHHMLARKYIQRSYYARGALPAFEEQRFLMDDNCSCVQEYLASAKAKAVKRPVGFDKLPEAAPVATNALLDFRNKKNKKRWARCHDMSTAQHLSVRFPLLFRVLIKKNLPLTLCTVVQEKVGPRAGAECGGTDADSAPSTPA